MPRFPTWPSRYAPNIANHLPAWGMPGCIRLLKPSPVPIVHPTMRYTLPLLLLLATPSLGAAQYRVGPIDVRDVVPLTPPPEYARWWAEVVALAGAEPATTFERVEWWTSTTPIRCPTERIGCRVHGLFMAPKDIVLSTSDATSECWVKHEAAHAILGKGDEAHGHRLFEAIWRSAACDGRRV